MPSAQVTQSAQVTEIPSAQVTARPAQMDGIWVTSLWVTFKKVCLAWHTKFQVCHVVPRSATHSWRVS